RFPGPAIGCQPARSRDFGAAVGRRSASPAIVPFDSPRSTSFLDVLTNRRSSIFRAACTSPAKLLTHRTITTVSKVNRSRLAVRFRDWGVRDRIPEYRLPINAITSRKEQFDGVSRARQPQCAWRSRQFSRRNSIISPQGFGVLLTGAVFGGDLQRRGGSRRAFDVRS